MKIFFFILLLLAPPAFAEDSIQIDITNPNLKKSLLAMPSFQYLGVTSINREYLKVGKELFDVVQFDLSVSSYFEFIKSSAFLEDVSKVGLRPAPQESGGFSFSSWKQIGTDFLMRVGYKIIGDDLTVETYLYYVKKSELVLGKTYKAKVHDARTLAHTYANDIVKQLTGVRGFFLTKIVASRGTAQNQREIYVMDWDGANPFAITHHQTISNSPAWSPDGKLIVYRSFAYHESDHSRNADLFSYDTSTGRRLLLSYRPGINSGASFFPDGRNLLLTVSNSGNPDIYKMTLDGRSLTRLTDGPHGALNVEPNISADGKKVVFSSDRAGRPMVFSMNVDGSDVKRLTIAGEFNSTPRWSPDGKKILFAGSDKGHYDIFLMDADGTNMSRLTSAKKLTGKMADNEDPSFSPDGRHVLFLSNRSGHNQLYVVDVDGENERRITFDNHDYYKPMWSPYLD